MSLLLPLLTLIFAYLIGSVPNGVIISKILKKKDPRKSGSGNIGATNVARTSGTIAGIIVLILDILKGFIPVYLTLKYSLSYQLTLFTGLFAFLGHTFPIYLKFKGGKGVATAIGIFLALVPEAVVIDAIFFTIVAILWRYVSLASIVSSIMLPGIIKLLLYTKLIHFNDNSIVLFAATVSTIIVFKHKDNILRLIKKRELKFGNNNKTDN